ncbi:oleate delta-12 desaturase [Aspergillus brunneoviolaceus CBS 621.78]|uniref:Oleate delta-12 desaturase n=1 Tax=Aspergillus brunneoviolaceus CBS 621.78 TaxID=1450534 RepID=A0ACD1GAJ4_9EURO|nr:oleate delta-12 desaturase [Aspergillus brunneoviolaceus CBS 621.78]RAH46250.1 oleate delta-12 desaturase [Aspergillus brunneoviolaceus CBS 621.78]
MTEHIPTLRGLKEAIPDSCFAPSLWTSLGYLTRDILYAAALAYATTYIPLLESGSLRFLAWLIYGLLQGFVGTGLWILAHECGHGAFSSYPLLNDIIGWVLHSSLLVPYFSWKITHARHHRYSGHMEKDTAFVPPTQAEYAAKRRRWMDAMEDLVEDTPLSTLLRFAAHQLLGWQAYLLFYATGAKAAISRPKAQTRTPLPLSHLSPDSLLFHPKQRPVVLLSDLGLALTISGLVYLGSILGPSRVMLLYFLPYFWVHHWIVAITYLHHTHPQIAHYSSETWSFTRGALGTVDRSFGFIGRHFFHHIIDHHVIHHLFPRIPFYRAEEATLAIKPLLGAEYLELREENFLATLWRTFRRCQFVIGGDDVGGKSGVFEWNVVVDGCGNWDIGVSKA